MLKAVLDTETLDLRTSAVIVSLGVTIFDDEKVDSFEDLVSRGINVYIDRGIQKYAGRTTSRSTMEWWDKQGEEAKLVFDQPGVSVHQVSVLIDQLISGLPVNKKHLKWYCRGPQFDIAKLEDLFRQFGVDCPWHYRKPRCSRTWLDEHGIDDDVKLQRPDHMIPHNSLHDAAFEAYMMQRVRNGVEIPRVN